MFTIIFSILCLFEATVLPICVQGDALTALADTNDQDLCCVSEDHEDDEDCGSICSPFQHCGCCNISANAFIALQASLTPFKQLVIDKMQSWKNLGLPDNFAGLLERPPKIS
ncbi:hypothetical protein [Sphingobacterium faecium]|uniref:hypothetical protein n=1 Tax=Sphingobacterium faecium TaxID=34087 RepID=UPI002479E0B2|nr:hypothetical protein [Sphingobacterium faecium]WGQ12817.1 hypothetical protein QG727_12345 [Sphingobacterium faecium]